MFEPKMLQSNAAHLVQKVSENAVHRLDLHHGAKEKKAVRTSKVMMGPRYERPMRSRPEPKEVSPEDKDAAQQLEDAERLVRPTSCCPRHSYRVIQEPKRLRVSVSVHVRPLNSRCC